MLIHDLQEVRKIRIQIRQLSEERERLEPSLSSPRLDGMPHGSGGGDGIFWAVDLRIDTDKRINDLARQAMEAEKRARKQMNSLTPNLYSLCVYYYIGALSVAETIRILHIARSTFYYWQKQLDTIG